MRSIIVFLFATVVAMTTRLPSAEAFRPSSTRSTATIRALKMDGAAEEGKDWVGAKKFSMKDRYTNTIISSEQISKILPHRYPFLLVDRVVEFEPGKRAVGIKCITANEPQFTGHFPDRPIMPGVLMIEAMAQLGGIICLSPPINNEGGGRIFFFTGVNGVRFKSPVTPGDDLCMEMSLVSFDERLGFATMTGKAYVGGRICVQVEEFTFALAR
jgi:3-hydroxyacyl-[acyl-carrier-protein] dehydratase